MILAGGGTAGHINPALAVADILRRKGAEILFVGTERGLEADLVPRAGYRLETIKAAPFPRRLSWRQAAAIYTAASGWRQAFGIIRRFRPHVVVGTGGYVAGPVVLAAVLLRIPTLIHEQNAWPGGTNRLLARWVDRVALGYEEAARYLRAKDKPVYTGNPVRAEVLAVSRTEAVRKLGLRPDRLTVVIMGGSRGAASINRAVWSARERLRSDARLQVIHQTGAAGFHEVKTRYESVGIHATDEGMIIDGQLRVVPYLYDMPVVLAAADIVISRAGALSLAEITARGLPSILVPYPHAAGDHQTFNARALVVAGAAQMIDDKELTGERLLATLLPLVENAEQRRKMAAAAKALGRPDAAEALVQLIVELGKKERRNDR